MFECMAVVMWSNSGWNGLEASMVEVDEGEYQG
jgi:hypothetical protein